MAVPLTPLPFRIWWGVVSLAITKHTFTCTYRIDHALHFFHNNKICLMVEEGRKKKIENKIKTIQVYN